MMIPASVRPRRSLLRRTRCSSPFLCMCCLIQLTRLQRLRLLRSLQRRGSEPREGSPLSPTPSSSLPLERWPLHEGRHHSPFSGVGDPLLYDKTTQGASQSEVALRDVRRGAGTGLAELEERPQTKRELERMASAFGPSSRILSRNAASEINFRRQFLGDFRVLSFATHGLVREEIDGLAEPALVLTPRDSKTPFNDGLLTATEISELPLRADLVILSACNSASFDVATFAYQAAGLSTAFFMAGARSTLASLWSVDSESTAQLMELLANEIASDSSVGSSLALRRAIQQFLSREESKSYRHPRFWAAFLVFGDGGRLPKKRAK